MDVKFGTSDGTTMEGVPVSRMHLNMAGIFPWQSVAVKKTRGGSLGMMLLKMSFLFNKVIFRFHVIPVIQPREPT